MGKEFKNIEDLFKATFDNYRVEPSAKVWLDIDSKLKVHRFLHSGMTKFLGLSIAIVLVGVLMFYPGAPTKTESAKPVNQPLQKEITGNSIQKTKNNNQETKYNSTKKDKKKYFKEKAKIQSLLGKQEKENAVESIKLPKILSKSISVIKTEKKNDKIDIKPLAPPAPLFSIESKEGCAPFTIQISNLSKNALAYEWDFGDGSKSKDANPQYIYRYPGVYKVILKAIGRGGVAVSYIDSIVVHEAPKADIIWPYENEVFTGQKVQVLNKSGHVAKIEWNFGDEYISNKKDAVHVYEKAGEYDICMKVWSAEGCVDSAVIKDIEVVDVDEKIVFPNAFTPNIDGPVSGYYNPASVYNDVFYPKYNGKIEEYELRIYSKYGVEVFKSNNINYGWNGYFNNRLMPEGVYVYIVTVKFENNQKFQFKGDITLLHRK